MEKRQVLYPVLIFGGLLAACFVFAIVLFKSVGPAIDEPNAWTSGKGPKVGVVEITGPITDSRRALEQLVEFRRDKEIKAIVVRIDSPGGAVAPSQEIYRAVKRAREDKHVVVSMGTVAASGGYYIAAAAEKIYALPGTITGSIGVISQFVQIEKLLELARVEATTIKSGPLKDVGSPLRPMTDDERKYLQGFVDGVYEQFLGDVVEGRKLEREAVRKLADGRILTGQEALAAKLVDEMGNLEEAIDGAAKLAGETGTPVPVFARKRRPLLQELVSDGAEGAAEGLATGLREAVRGGGTVEARDPRFR